ncbi:MAG TPA: stage II sporulation protein M [Candidatus Nanoarchaeia archaeon]|nr:stage II sporulation protein M [Candidatus Nanoarchaeia archaeon]
MKKKKGSSRKSPSKSFSIKKEYKKSIEYVKESKEFIYFAILLFAIFFALGLFFQDVINSASKNTFGVNIDEKILNLIEDLLKQTEGMGQKELIGFIFLNNVQSSLISMFVGIILGIVPFFSTLVNGYVLGFVAELSVKSGGITTLWRIFPHGLFELPAVFISLGLGFRLGTIFFRKDKRKFLENLRESLKAFLLIVLPLLIVAAIIEGTLIAFGS